MFWGCQILDREEKIHLDKLRFVVWQLIPFEALWAAN